MKNNSEDFSLIFMPIKLFLTRSIFTLVVRENTVVNLASQILQWSNNILIYYMTSLKKFLHNYLGMFTCQNKILWDFFSFVSEFFKYPLVKVFATLICTGPEVTFWLLLLLRVFRNPFISLRSCSLAPFNSRTIILLHNFHARLSLIFFYFSAISLFPIFLLTHHNISYA